MKSELAISEMSNPPEICEDVSEEVLLERIIEIQQNTDAKLEYLLQKFKELESLIHLVNITGSI